MAEERDGAAVSGASLCNLDKLPPKGAILIAASLKIVNGTGSPFRALALDARN
jgi:kynurenine formamidase